MNNLDQFYTNDEIAKECYDIFKEYINVNDYDIFLEPCAGNGSFYKLFDKNKRKGIDIDPKCENVIRMNFLDYKPLDNKRYFTLTNPPSGKISSLAVKFFNKCAEFNEVIGMIVPRTFKRD